MHEPSPAPDRAYIEQIVKAVLDRQPNQQLAAVFRIRWVWGSVTGAGAVNTAGSGDWTPSRTAAGTYTIDYAPDFSATPGLVACCDSAAVGIAEVSSAASTAAAGRVITYNPDAPNAAADFAFHFVAIGLR